MKDRDNQKDDPRDPPLPLPEGSPSSNAPPGGIGPRNSVIERLIRELIDLFERWWNQLRQEPGDTAPSPPEPPEPTDGGLPPGGAPGGGTGCFVAATPVLMADGSSKPIADIAIGDEVLARDEASGAYGPQAVTRTFRHDVTGTLVLRLDSGERIETTAVHRFARDGEFVGAGDLRVGDVVATRDGGTRTIAEASPQPGAATVYNLSVRQFRTYFVGEAGVWVHNLKMSDPEDPDDDEGFDWP